MGSDARATAIDAGERRPLEQPRAPEELAELVHVRAASDPSRGGRTARSSRRRCATDRWPRRGQVLPAEANSGTSPRPRAFQIVSVITAGTTAAATTSAARQRRASANATTAPARNSAFAGLTPIAKPRTSPARAPSALDSRASARNAK